jgi:hypothetical protein
MESSMEVPQKAKNKTTIWSSDTTPGHIAEGNKSVYNRDTCHPYLWQHCPQLLSYENSPDALQLMNGLRKCHTHTHTHTHTNTHTHKQTNFIGIHHVHSHITTSINKSEVVELLQILLSNYNVIKTEINKRKFGRFTSVEKI